MKRMFRLLACFALACAATSAPAQGRILGQPELDSLLAPIALYPDPLLSHVLNAAVYPQDVAEAAAWSRANPRLQGDDALRAVDSYTWHPSVKALVAYPDILARMAESPQWVADLGEAYLVQSPEVTATIQGLRARAQNAGYLQSNDQQQVYSDGGAIYVQPVYPQYVWTPYYDPYVVYGAWWWPAFAPFYFRPWFPRHVVVTHVNIIRHAPPIHWHGHGHGRPHSTPVRTGGGQWAAQPPRPVHNGTPPQPRPSPVRTFTPASTPPPRTSPPPWANAPTRAPQQVPQHISQHMRMPAAHVRATPTPMPQHFAAPSRGHAGGGWASAGRGHARGGGGRRG